MKSLITFVTVTLLFLIVIACKKTEEPLANRPPNGFNVNATLQNDGKTVKLTWTKAKDPDNDVVTYTIFAQDTLAKNLSDTTFILSNLDFNAILSGKIIAKDPKGLISEASFTATTAQMIRIPDAVFEKYLIDKKIDSDGVVNGYLKPEDALKTKKLELWNYKKTPINDLTGIEAFTNLESLNCRDNYLTSLDLSKNINLKELICAVNSLTNLDVSNNIKLETLMCTLNKLTSLNVSKNVNLVELGCDLNYSMTSLDVSKNINLKSLYCYSNSIANLDVSKNINLIILSCFGNNLTSLDVSKNLNLQSLFCYSNQLTNLDVSKNVNLKTLSCYSNAPLTTVCVADIIKAETNTSWKKEATTVYKICQ